MMSVLARTVVLAFTLCWSILATADVAVPPLNGRVVDQTGTLNAEQVGTLTQTLQAFEAQKGSQIAVLLVPTTSPESIEQYSIRVVDQWKLGRKKIDDGVLLIIAKNDRTLRIEVGYGLEGALNDATSKRIISETITPYFKQGDFYGGIAAGVDQIIRVTGGEPLPPPVQQGAQSSDIGQHVPTLFMTALILGWIFRLILGRFPGALVTGGIVTIVAWFMVGALSFALIAGFLALVFTLLDVGMGGGGFSGGSGRSDGFSGGGGGFGGGGASGRW